MMSLVRGHDAPPEGGLPSQPKPPDMRAHTDRLRLAISVFYDVERLCRTLVEFAGLGLTAKDLCLAGQSADLDKGAALHRALTEKCAELAPLLERIIKLDGVGKSAKLCVTNGPVIRALRRPQLPDGPSCLETLMAGEVGTMIRDHASKRGIITAARAATPQLQDQCVRVLLRHSQHTVHAQECRYEAG